MKSLYVVDAVNLLFRSYYAIKGMTNLKGESTNALFGFIRSIYKLIEGFSPDHLIAVFDGPDNKKSRSALYADYKSHRKGMPEDLVPQLEKALYWCELAGIPNLAIPGVEADDTMGSIARWAAQQGATVFLCSSDKDLCQMVSDHIFMIQLHKDNLVVDKKQVFELYGVHPEQMIDYLALVGDASDNIPGLEGFGPKTAATLLQQFGTLEEILKHPDQVAGEKKQQILREGKEIAYLSQKLATIDTSVDFPHEEHFFHLKEPHLEMVQAFYHEMNFLSLLKTIKQEEVKGEHQYTHSDSRFGSGQGDALDLSQAKPTPKQLNLNKLSGRRQEPNIEPECVYHLISTEEALDALITQLKKEKEICFDTETTDVRPLWAKLVGIGLGVRAGEAWYTPLNGEIRADKVLKKMASLFGDKELRFFGHNVKYDLHVLQNENLPLPALSFDTILASYLLNPEQPRHNLDYLSLEKFQKIKIPIEDLIGKGKNQRSMQEVELEKIKAYCCEDVDYTTRLKALFKQDLKEKNLTSVLETLELPLLKVLFKMERRGIYADASQLKKMSKELEKEAEKLEKEIHHLAGHPFNIHSPKQLSVVLFEEMGMTPPKKTQTGYSTSADVLQDLQDASPLVSKVIEYRFVEKLRSTYVDALPEAIHPQTGRIHCTFNQSVAATGRLSCQDPNLQNIPIRSEEGIKIREAFRPEQNGWSFLSADYSQIELRLLAHLSEDPDLLKAFHEGQDVHAYTASLVFDVPLKEVTPEMRQKAKAVNFGILYGQQAFGLSQGLKMGYKEAASFIETYFQRYKKVKQFFEFCKESVRKTGYAVTLTGRKRPIPDIDSKNPMLRSAAERLALNTPLQGTAADLIKMAMIDIDDHLEHHPAQGYMLLQIHDELLFEVPDEELSTLSAVVKNKMENVLHLKVPLEVHISVGKNWGAC